MVILESKIVIHAGAPCEHPGCLSHLSHPCEGCGRVGGKGDVTDNPFDYLLKEHKEAKK